MCELVYIKMLLFGSRCFQKRDLTNAIEAGPCPGNGEIWRQTASVLAPSCSSCRTRGLAVVTQGGHFGLNLTVVPSLNVALVIVYWSRPTNVWCTGLNMTNSPGRTVYSCRGLVEIEPNTGAKHSGCQWTWWRMSDIMQYTFCVEMTWKSEHLPSTIFDNIRTLNSKQNNQYFAAIF